MTIRAGITGHQRLEDPSGWTWVESELRKQVKSLVPWVIGISSLAIGADQLFARIVIEEGGELCAIIPFNGYERTFGPEGIDIYRSLLSKSSSVEVLDVSGTDADKYVAAGRRIVQLSDIFIAVWDGRPAKGKGGTGDSVAYAIEKGTRLVYINPVTRTVTIAAKDREDDASD